MCDHFWYEEDWQGISVTHNIGSDKGVHKIVVWVNHSRNWNVLQCLTKLGWELKWKVVNYNAADWKYYDKITKYSWKCKKKKKSIFNTFLLIKILMILMTLMILKKRKLIISKGMKVLIRKTRREEGGGVILKQNNNCNFSYFLVIVLNMYFVCLNWMGAQFYLQNGKLCTWRI